MPVTQSSAAAATAERQRRPLLAFGPFTFDPNSRLLRRGQEEIPLPPRVLGVLEILLARAGDVVPRLELMDTVWRDAFVTDTSLAEAVSVLRQALGDDPQSPTYIQTLHRRGYRFVAPVSGIEPEDEGRASTEVATAPISPSILGQLLPWSLAALSTVAAIVAIWQLTRTQRDEPSAARFEIALPGGMTFDRRVPGLALSPDGSALAWSACDRAGCRLFLRSLNALDVRAVPGTDGAQSPFFSPDGRWLGFFADGRLQRVAIAGGAPVLLADAPQPMGGVWIDREIVFAGSLRGGLMRVSAEGGETQPLTTPREQDGEVRHGWPSVAPDGNTLLFTIEMTPEEDALAAIGAMSLAGGVRARPWRTLLAGAMARAGASDVIVFARGNDLQAIAFDPARLATSGEARTVVGGVGRARGGAQYAVSTAGAIIYAPATLAADAGGLVWWAKSEQRETPEKIRHLRAARLSPDGTRVAGVALDGARADIWVADVERGAATRLTHAGVNTSPVWSADGRAIYFGARTNGGVFEIWRRDAEGISPATRVFGTSRHAVPLAVAPDAATLAFLQTGESTRADVWALPLNGGAPHPLVQGIFDDSAAAFSPDSRLCAYQSAESGRSEIHLLRLHDGRRVVVSTEGGERPVWTRDALYYQSRGRLIRATIAEAVGDLRIASMETIVEGLIGTVVGMADDGRFLLDRESGTRSSSAVVSLEWMREVRLLLGPPTSALPR